MKLNPSLPIHIDADDVRHPGINLGGTDPKTHEAAEETMFGFWVYLMSDLIIFSLLFATYASMTNALAGGPGPDELFDFRSVAIETGLLLVSSFTYGMVSLSLKYGDGIGGIIFWLAVTLLLGLIFLGFEGHDFLDMVRKGAGPTRSGFLSSFFILVPTHGLHVLTGCVWILVMMLQLAVFGVNRDVKLRIMRLGLFWHFLDIVWVGIFTVVYLRGLA